MNLKTIKHSITTKFGTIIEYIKVDNIVTKKKCTECFEFKDLKLFPKNNFSLFKRDNKCKSCECERIKNIRRKQGIPPKKPKVTYDAAGKPVARICTHCKEIKNFSEYSKSKSGFLGHESLCRECKNKKHIKKPKKETKRFDVIKNNFGETTHKFCTFCDTMKLISCYNNSKNGFLGKEGICRNCKKEHRILRKYGITIEDKRRIYKKQNNQCVGCGSKKSIYKICVDHNHKNGEVRGLLCRTCNAAIGLLGDDNSVVFNRLTNIIDYITSYSENILEEKHTKTKRLRSPKIRKGDYTLDKSGNVTSKKCSSCKNLLPKQEFGIHKSGFMGIRSRCKKCEKEIRIEKTYNINYNQKILLYKNQNSKCGVCQNHLQIDKLCIDHDHTTNKVRGLLCSNCNAALGFFGDGTEKTKTIINNLLLYLDKPSRL